MKKVIFSCETISILLLLFVSVASAETYEVQVDGTDAIFLAGARTSQSLLFQSDG